MFKLVTGKPGDGKTSNELWDFLNAKEYKGRDKFCTPIKGFDAAKHGVTEIPDVRGWRELPEGCVIFIDEVQDYLGLRSGKEVPEWIKDFAKHRHDGKDIIATTQDPMFIDPFVRKLCKPHVHYIRPWNMKGCRYTWDSVQNDPTTKTAKKSGQSELITPNPEVFKLYTSTVLDTHKARPPWKVIIVGVLALVMMIGGISTAIYLLANMNEAPPAALTTLQEVGDSAATGTYAPIDPAGVPKTWTVENLKPAIAGMPHTAPIYDGLTAPSDFPRVAACIYSRRTGCDCYSQQATPLDIPESACLAHVSDGTFDHWLSSRQQDARTPSPNKQAEAIASDDPRHEGRTGDGITIVNSGKPGLLW
ncbi:zonular occludens toxin domain-containing protein [Pseudomonas sp.]|uniref:zonular occludens toxin domain-containing protein n=1 Tax=Pseudomonas sp. TaxID=306 RepID=UPI0037C5AB7C